MLRHCHALSQAARTMSPPPPPPAASGARTRTTRCKRPLLRSASSSQRHLMMAAAVVGGSLYVAAAAGVVSRSSNRGWPSPPLHVAGRHGMLVAWSSSSPPPPPSSVRLWTRSSSLTISSADNDRLKQLRALLGGGKKARVKAGGVVLLEGHRLVLDAAEAGHVPTSVLLTREAIEQAPLGPRLESLLESLPWSCVSLVSPSSLLASCLDTVTPQGVAALIPQPATTISSSSSTGGGVLLVLDGVQDPGNCGTLIRSAAACGARAVLCVGPGADPWGAKAMRAAMGATFRIPVITKPAWDQGVWEEELGGLRVMAADGGEGLEGGGQGVVQDYDQVDWCTTTTTSGGCALVVGAEGAGLSGEVRRALRDGRATAVRIPLSSGVESLNAAVAGSILLAEAQRQRPGRHRQGGRKQRGGGEEGGEQ